MVNGKQRGPARPLTPERQNGFLLTHIRSFHLEDQYQGQFCTRQLRLRE
jgi:hypothetical protein